MKNILSIALVIFSLNIAQAALDEMILVQGHIDSSDDKTNVKVTDNNGQKLVLPRTAFPKKFDFRKGNYFSIEVTDEIFDSLNRKPVKKNR
jgi:hypothetical protein